MAMNMNVKVHVHGNPGYVGSHAFSHASAVQTPVCTVKMSRPSTRYGLTPLYIGWQWVSLGTWMGIGENGNRKPIFADLVYWLLIYCVMSYQLRQWPGATVYLLIYL